MHDIVLILRGEILFWSLMGVRLFHCKEREGWESQLKRLSWSAVLDYVFESTRLSTGMHERTSSCRPCANFPCVENSLLPQLGEIHCLTDIEWHLTPCLRLDLRKTQPIGWIRMLQCFSMYPPPSHAISFQLKYMSNRTVEISRGNVVPIVIFFSFFPQICKAHAACEHLRLYAIVDSKIIRHPSGL